jgi:thiol-disulfide isomerase/thioredoxin
MSRPLLATVPFLAVLPLLALAGCAQKSEVDALKEQVVKLEERVAAAEKKGGAGAAGAAAASPEDEAAASKLMEELQGALKTSDYPTAKAKIAELSAKYSGTRAGKAAVRMATEVNLVGSDAKPIEVQKWYTKEQGSLADNKVTMLVFWEVWCPHCKKEVPLLPAKLEKYKSKGLGIIALTKVTKSATEESVEAFIKDSKLTFPVGKEPEGGPLSAAYAVSGIPAAALVKDGKVIWRGHPARLTDELLEQMLAG